MPRVSATPGAVDTEVFPSANGDALLPALLSVAAAVIAWFRRDTVVALLAQVAPDRFGK
ncbi:hypothetical protein FHS29_000173 [Saccharothrix tamanrassetensis]|uniref:Uncharacterized protein n=1 Tax=Saccharothrix tamanrassetensis TaxID=1051531 RepID=A0A841C9J0_9PSEU|nr:hypothetical protein [Saccharothrix tamanrassetensis]MBB5953603.1 hypothetical protein [Saccharothrix tamanrassetensis]